LTALSFVMEDHILQYFTSWIPQIVPLYRNGDSGNDSFISASFFPFPATHQLLFTSFRPWLYHPRGCCLYSCRYFFRLITFLPESANISNHNSAIGLKLVLNTSHSIHLDPSCFIYLFFSLWST